VRRVQWCGAVVGVVMVGLLALPGSAGAASSVAVTVGSPGPTIDGSSTQSGPSQQAGTSFNVTACGLASRAAVTIVANGSTASTMAAGADSCAASSTVVTDSHVTVNGGAATGSPGAIETDASTTPGIRPPAPAAGFSTMSDDDFMSVGIDALALLALAFLVLTFARRRIVSS
jgi:hypothetical protein